MVRHLTEHPPIRSLRGQQVGCFDDGPELVLERLRHQVFQVLEHAKIRDFDEVLASVCQPGLELTPRREHRMASIDDFIVISGCSGGGKSTLLDALEDRGHHIVKETGRRIVAEELANGDSALPWGDPVAFARRAIRLSLADRAFSRDRSGWVFFDRGLIDAASALEDLADKPVLNRLARRYRYNKNVFLTPPWPEIYVKDNERRHDLADGVDEYKRLCKVYPSLGYKLHILPKASVADRADLVLKVLASTEASRPAER